MANKQERNAVTRINHDRYIELRFEEASRQAVDDVVAHLLDILAENVSGQPLRIFVNNGDVRRSQSISYLLGQMRAHQKQFSVSFPVRVAVNFNMMLIASLLELFVRSLPTNKIQFKAFSILDIEGAVEWVLQDDPQTSDESS